MTPLIGVVGLCGHAGGLPARPTGSKRRHGTGETFGGSGARGRAAMAQASGASPAIDDGNRGGARARRDETTGAEGLDRTGELADRYTEAGGNRSRG
jgi:hypothetical protein